MVSTELLSERASWDGTAAARPAATGSTPAKGPASGLVVIGSVTADGVTLVRIRPPEPFTRKDR